MIRLLLRKPGAGSSVVSGVFQQGCQGTSQGQEDFELSWYLSFQHWARWSNMLAPLTSLVGECSQTKSTKAKGTKEVPWHWDKVHQRAFDHVKATIAKDLVLANPDYSKVFEIWYGACVGGSKTLKM